MEGEYEASKFSGRMFIDGTVQHSDSFGNSFPLFIKPIHFTSARIYICLFSLIQLNFTTSNMLFLFVL